MSVDMYASSIGLVRSNLKKKKELANSVKVLEGNLAESKQTLIDMLEAQKLLSAVSDENTYKTLDFITGLVNKVLSELFPNGASSIKLTKKLFAGSRPHVVLEIYDEEGYVLNTSEQCGDGLKQVISFMYVLCLIEIRKCRRVVILDEKLNGLHRAAKDAIANIIKLFVKGGYQFIFVEYSLDRLGKLYNVEKRGKVAKVVPINGEYEDSTIYVDDVDLSVLSQEGEQVDG